VDAKQLFFERYEGFQEYPQHLVSGLTDTQLRQAPHAALNPISWTLWHIARSEDIGVNRLLVDRPQVFDECDWSSRLRVSRKDFGTGMSKAEVAQLCESINLAELDAYRTAVGERTVAMVTALPLAELSDILSQDLLRQVLVNEEAGGTMAGEIVKAYEGHTKGWLLGHLVLTHSYYHIGQAFGVRAMLGAANPW